MRNRYTYSRANNFNYFKFNLIYFNRTRFKRRSRIIKTNAFRKTARKIDFRENADDINNMFVASF